jgi:hypothetical protein
MLYRQTLDLQPQIVRDQRTRGRVHEQVEDLLGELRALSLGLTAQGGWAGQDWLQAAAADWERAFEALFDERRDLLAELQVPAKLPEAPRARPCGVIPYDEILNGVRKTAYHLGLERKEQVIRRRIRELEEIRDDRGRIHRVLASSPEEREEDWRLAMVHFAADVLALRTSFVYQLDDRSWTELARIGLEDVKRLDAYYQWEDTGRLPRTCYLDACEQLRSAVLASSAKAPAADFAALYAFLGEGGSSGRAEVLRAKAHLRWLTRVRRGQPGSAETDWHDAAEHARRFYDNLEGAIQGSGAGQERCLRQALAALREPWREQGMVSCLEAAIAISFFDPTLTAKVVGADVL